MKILLEVERSDEIGAYLLEVENGMEFITVYDDGGVVVGLSSYEDDTGARSDNSDTVHEVESPAEAFRWLIEQVQKRASS